MISVLIPLSNGGSTVIDQLDGFIIANSTWHRNANGYVSAKIKGELVLLHRLILNVSKGLEVDHINGDKVDNRRCNLRIVTHAQNTKNRSKNTGKKYKGVGFEKRSNSWRARIRVDYKHKYLGNFKTEREAALAYNIAAIIYHGSFAKLNEVP